MVQRKVPNKLGIQADHHVKSEKRLANLKTTSSSQNQDGRNRGGTDLKKKMKKSRSFKLSDFESLRSSLPSKRKPPPPIPPDVPTTTTAAPIPQKQQQQQSMMKAPDCSPNYMKSTSSFEARKECTQVSSKNLTSRRNPKLDSTLTKTSSLKLVRTLTKTPSFKHTRSSAKKVAVCADAHRATCSSALKDSKFPTHLTLSPGGTESEGTSIMKVCPYTYCSLNGHHHAPLPPLKCFLSARRRLMKTQKSMKLELLFPCKAKPADAGKKEIAIEQQIISDEKPAFQDEIFVPMVPEVGMDFFIEIYAKDKEDTAETSGSSTERGGVDKITDFAGKMDDLNDIKSSVGDVNETEEHGDRQVAQSISDGSPHSEIHSDDNTDQNSDITLAEMDMVENFLVEQKIEDGNGSDWEEECSASIELDHEYTSEASDMEWEEGQFSTSHPDNEADDATQADKESGLNVSYLSEIGKTDFDNKSIFKPAGTVSNCFKEEPTAASEENNVVCEAENEIVGRDSQLGDDDTNCTMADEAWETYFSKDEDANALCRNQIIGSSSDFTEIEQDETNEAVTEKGRLGEKVIDISLLPMTEDSETTQNVATSDISQEQQAPNTDAGDGMEEKDQVDNAKSLAVILDSLQGCSETEEENTGEDTNENCTMMELCHHAAIAEDGELSRDLADSSLPSESEYQAADEKFQNSSVVETHNLSEQNHREAELKKSTSMNSEEQSDTEMNKYTLAKSSNAEVDKMEVEDETQLPDAANTCLTAKTMLSPETEDAFVHARINTNQELHNASNILKGKIRCKRPINDSADPRKFNPREPNYLPVEPDPEAEKVDLRHQMMDERKNAEEWMVDYALQQAVSKLAPARKRKVALLVEAFETVTPIPKYETHLRHTTAVFAHARPIQACS